MIVLYNQCALEMFSEQKNFPMSLLFNILEPVVGTLRCLRFSQMGSLLSLCKVKALISLETPLSPNPYLLFIFIFFYKLQNFQIFYSAFTSNFHFKPS